MAGSNGGDAKDLLLKLLEGQERIEARLDKVDARIGRVEASLLAKLNDTNGTLTLIGRVLNELTINGLARINNHEERLLKLEEAPRP